MRIRNRGTNVMSEFKLPEKWQQRWDEEGFTTPSLIQESVYRPLIEGESLVGISPTGSGKTLSYLYQQCKMFS